MTTVTYSPSQAHSAYFVKETNLKSRQAVNHKSARRPKRNSSYQTPFHKQLEALKAYYNTIPLHEVGKRASVWQMIRDLAAKTGQLKTQRIDVNENLARAVKPVYRNTKSTNIRPHKLH